MAGLWAPYEVFRIKPRSAACKANIFLAVLLQWLLKGHFLKGTRWIAREHLALSRQSMPILFFSVMEDEITKRISGL